MKDQSPSVPVLHSKSVVLLSLSLVVLNEGGGGGGGKHFSGVALKGEPDVFLYINN